MKSNVFDESLGPASERYFGVGYRHTTQRCVDVAVSHRPDGGLTLTATARIEPWDRRGVARVTHLGTVDAMAIAATVGSLALIAAGRAPAGSECAVESVDIRSGAVAETDVENVPVTAEWRGDDPSSTVQRVHCRIGRLRVAVDLRIPDTAGALLRALPPGPVDAEHLLGPREHRYFAEGYREPELRGTALELTERSGTCDFVTAPRPERFGVVECLVVTSQLAQALLYSAVGARREQTGNLWMRRCEFSAIPAEPGTDDPSTPDPGTPDRAVLDATKVVRLDRRTPEVVSADVRIASFPGWTGTAALAFELR